MGGERTVRLGSVCTKIGSGATPRGGKEAYKGGATTLIRSQNIYNDGFHHEGLALIDDNQAGELKNVEVQEHDVLLNITGDSVARCCQVDSDILPARVNQHVAIIRPRQDELDARFLRYVLIAPSYQSHLLGLASAGATRNALTKAMIEDLEIELPPLPEQRTIAHILGTLDDKIELNRRMNATLEEMARALFKSWFVDFDPVRAKMEGRETGLPDEIAALFPERLVETEVGVVPEGWEMKQIGDFIERLPVGQKYEQRTVNVIGNIPVLDQGKSGIIGYHNNLPGVNASTDSPVVVFANHTCYMRLIPFPFSAIQNVLPFIGKSVDTIWTYYATYGKQFFIEYKGHWPDFIIHKVALPTPELTREFARIVRPFIKQIWKREDESRTLAALRDGLLPGLVGGGIKIEHKDY